MKKVIAILSLAISSSAFAGHQNICRDKFLNLIGVDASPSHIEVTKQFVGKIISSNFSDRTAGQCIVAVDFYQPGTSIGSISLDVKNSILTPFNHSVGADNDPASCASDGESLGVSGSSELTQGFGWRHRFYTALSLSKNINGSFTLSYQQEHNKLTCIGNFQ